MPVGRGTSSASHCHTPTPHPPHSPLSRYGLPNCFGSEEFGAAVVKIAETCKKNNKIAGFWNSDVEAQGKLGFRFMVVDGDIHAMQAALQTSIAEKREKIKAAAM